MGAERPVTVSFFQKIRTFSLLVTAQLQTTPESTIQKVIRNSCSLFDIRNSTSSRPSFLRGREIKSSKPVPKNQNDSTLHKYIRIYLYAPCHRPFRTECVFCCLRFGLISLTPCLRNSIVLHRLSRTK